jgi:hypothetical protein
MACANPLTTTNSAIEYVSYRGSRRSGILCTFLIVGHTKRFSSSSPVLCLNCVRLVIVSQSLQLAVIYDTARIRDEIAYDFEDWHRPVMYRKWRVVLHSDSTTGPVSFAKHPWMMPMGTNDN